MWSSNTLNEPPPLPHPGLLRPFSTFLMQSLISSSTPLPSSLFASRSSLVLVHPRSRHPIGIRDTMQSRMRKPWTPGVVRNRERGRRRAGRGWNWKSRPPSVQACRGGPCAAFRFSLCSLICVAVDLFTRGPTGGFSPVRYSPCPHNDPRGSATPPNRESFFHRPGRGCS